MIEIRRLEGLRPSIRERFYERVYTAREREICAGRAERYAARFAAKEAVSKALGTGIGPVSWRDIEIDTDAAGAPVLRLYRAAAAKSAELGLTDWSISLTHAKEHCAAVAVAVGTGTPAL